VVVPLALVAGFVGGGLWGAIPGALKAYFNVNEILSTVMMNAIAVQIMNYLLRGPMIDPAQAELASQIPQTAPLDVAFRLPRLIPTRLHLGAAIAIGLAILVYILLWRTTLGYRIRAVGQNPDASRYGGIRVRRQIVIALLLSGAFAGLAGVIQVYGLNYRMITDGSATGFTGSPARHDPGLLLFRSAAGRGQQAPARDAGALGLYHRAERFGGGLCGEQRHLAETQAAAAPDRGDAEQ
jgi:simple sugar transport system permease protein